MPIKIAGVIPAHLASVRFPRKILFPFYGLPMIEHVRRRALLCKALTDVYVATCDQEIADQIIRFGGKVIMTADHHLNGTSRVAEAVSGMDCTHVMLLQGDEPLLLPRHLDQLAKLIVCEPQGDAWNATGPVEEEDDLDRHSFVKCAVSPNDRILYCFRRTPCYSPFDVQRSFIRKILGVLAFRKEFLLELTSHPASPIEQAEFIEQMRIIENGYMLRSVPVSHSLPSVNEPDEAEIVMAYIKGDSEQRQLLEQVIAK
ncbi:MAG: NTP transferase domain-containing protein [Deltaproteobacteria bacterium]|nr:NTP transferase domain-containing protein [Deltaproteobacteria bacterium]